MEQNAEYAALDAAGKRTMSQKALAVIRMNTSSGLRIHIDSANSAKDAWEALESIFTTESLGAKNRMRDELHALRREEKETAFEFASRAKTLQCRMLDGCGIRVPDDEIIHAVMRGLGPEYTIFKRCMSQTVKSMTLNEFCNRLLEEQPDSSMEQLESELQAFHVQNSGGRQAKAPPPRRSHKPKAEDPPKSKRFTGKCFNCGKKGHRKPDCPALKMQTPTDQNASRAEKDPPAMCNYLVYNVSEVVDSPSADEVEEHVVDTGDVFNLMNCAKACKVLMENSTGISIHTVRNVLPTMMMIHEKYPGISNKDLVSIFLGTTQPTISRDARALMQQHDFMTPWVPNLRHEDDDFVYHVANQAAAGEMHIQGKLQRVLFDSGTNVHVANFKSGVAVKSYTPFASTANRSVQMGGGEKHRALGLVDYEIAVQEGFKLQITGALYVPTVTANLISVSKAAKSSKSRLSFGEHDVIATVGGREVIIGKLSGGFYETSVTQQSYEKPKTVSWAEPLEVFHVSYDLLHKRLGHPSPTVIKHMCKHDCLKCMPEKLGAPSHVCESCMKAHQAKLPFDESDSIADKPMTLVHVDTMGPFPLPSISGARYAVVMIDDYSRMIAVVCVKSKADIPERLTFALGQLQHLSRQQMLFMRSDYGSEFINARVRKFLDSQFIKHQKSCVYTPEQNGRVERSNRSLMEKLRALMFESHAPACMWEEALNTAVKLYNMTASTRRKKTPYELFWGIKPSCDALRVFGCKAFVQVPEQKRNKLDERSVVGTMIGYSQSSKAYRILIPDGDRFKVTESRHVRFDENAPGPWMTDKSCTDEGIDFSDNVLMPNMGRMLQQQDFHPAAAGIQQQEGAGVQQQDVQQQDEMPMHEPEVAGQQIDDADEVHEPHEHLDEAELNAHDNDGQVAAAQELQVAAQEQGMIDADMPELEDASVASDLQDPEELDDHAPGEQVMQDQIAHEPEAGEPPAQFGRPKRNTGPPARYADYRAYHADLQEEPRTFHEIKFRLDKEQWYEAIAKENQDMIKNGMYDVIDCSDMPPGTKAIPTKYVFKFKKDELGRIERFRARFVAMGCEQKEGIDYVEVYAPVSKYATARMLMSEVVQNDLDLVQLDVTAAFMHSDLEETVYVKPPPDYPIKGKVWKLNKAMNGLKQAGRAWFMHLKRCLLNLGMTVAHADESLYIFRADGDDREPTYVLVYVDDLILAGKRNKIQWIIESLKKQLEIVDKGDAKLFLGMEIIRDRAAGTLWLGQSQHASDLLSKFGMTQAKGRKTPLDVKLSLQKFDGTANQKDLKHYQSLIGSLLYLANCTRPDLAQSVGLLARFMSNPSQEHMEAGKQVLRYLAGTKELGLSFKRSSPNSIKGYCDADYAGDLDKRKSTSGYVFTRSGGAISWSSKLQSTVAQSTCEAEFIAAAHAAKEALWLRDLQAEFRRRVDPVMMFGDNQGALKLIHHPHAHQRTKHIDVAHRFVQDRVERGELQVEYISTHDMVADCMTKGVPMAKLWENIRDMGLTNRPA